MAAYKRTYRLKSLQHTNAKANGQFFKSSHEHLAGDRRCAGKMQRVKRESHTQRLAITDQFETVHKRQLNTHISLKLCLSKKFTNEAIVKIRVRFRWIRCGMLMAVSTRMPLIRDMIGTQKNVQTLPKH